MNTANLLVSMALVVSLSTCTGGGGSDTNGTVTDNIAPEITLVGDNPMTISQGSTFVEPGSTVTDNVDTGLIATVTGTVDTSTIGSYDLNYNVTDAAGNVATTVTRTVNVVLLEGAFTSSGAVEGLTYTTETQSGTTGSTGNFSYKNGETITFSLGDTVIGEAVAAKTSMTPLDLIPSAVLYTTYSQLVHVLDRLPHNASKRIAFNKFHNILTFLQALDEDKNPDNGIYINSGMATLFTGIQIDFAMRWQDFDHSDRDNSLLRTRTHQAFSQGILSNAFIPDWGVALDQYYRMQSISHDLVILSSKSKVSDVDDNLNTSYTYDANGNILTKTRSFVDTPANDSISTKTYDANDQRLTSTYDSNSTNDSGVNETTTYTYDEHGNKLTVTDVEVDDPNNNAITTYTYDANGNQLTFTIDSNSTNDSGVNQTATYTYDANGNKLTETYVNIDDTNNNVISTFTYDANGNELTRTRDYDATNNPGVNETITITYDDNGNELTVTRVDLDNDVNNSITTYTYDTNGNKLTYSRDRNSTNDPGVNQTATYTYDINNNQLTNIYSDVDTSANDSISTYTFDANGNRLTYTRDNNSTNDSGVNQTVTYTYDDNGNRLTETYVDTDNTGNNSIATYTYDANGNRLTYASDDNSTNDPGVNSTTSSTWGSSTWVAVLFYIEDL